MGSGSWANRGTEITPGYVEIAERRLKQVDPLLNTVEVLA
jgi:hypothetical protein